MLRGQTALKYITKTRDTKKNIGFAENIYCYVYFKDQPARRSQ